MFANAVCCAAVSVAISLPTSFVQENDNSEIARDHGNITAQDLAGNRLLELAGDSALPPSLQDPKLDRLMIGFGRRYDQNTRTHRTAFDPLDGEWRLRWDDETGNGLAEEFHECKLRLRNFGHQVDGEFVGPVAGRIRQALITGKVIRTGNSTMLLLEQHEAGYCCHYQINFANGTGTWVDTQGRQGDFELLKFQTRKPATSTADQ